MERQQQSISVPGRALRLRVLWKRNPARVTHARKSKTRMLEQEARTLEPARACAGEGGGRQGDDGLRAGEKTTEMGPALARPVEQAFAVLPCASQGQHQRASACRNRSPSPPPARSCAPCCKSRSAGAQGRRFRSPSAAATASDELRPAREWRGATADQQPRRMPAPLDFPGAVSHSLLAPAAACRGASFEEPKKAAGRQATYTVTPGPVRTGMLLARRRAALTVAHWHANRSTGQRNTTQSSTVLARPVCPHVCDSDSARAKTPSFFSPCGAPFPPSLLLRRREGKGPA